LIPGSCPLLVRPCPDLGAAAQTPIDRRSPLDLDLGWAGRGLPNRPVNCLPFNIGQHLIGMP
jgi:hypothetical protein